MLEATGGSKVFATLMSSMAATAEKEDIRTFFFLEDVEVDFKNLSLLGQGDNDDDDNSLDGVFFNVEDAEEDEEDEVDDDGYEDSEDDHDVRHHNLPHPPPQRSNDSSMKGNLKIQAFGGRIILRPMSAMSTSLIEMDVSVESFGVCFVFRFLCFLI